MQQERQSRKEEEEQSNREGKGAFLTTPSSTSASASAVQGQIQCAGQLIAKRFSTSRRQNYKAVFVEQSAIEDGLLVRPERLDFEDLLQSFHYFCIPAEIAVISSQMLVEFSAYCLLLIRLIAIVIIIVCVSAI